MEEQDVVLSATVKEQESHIITEEKEEGKPLRVAIGSSAMTNPNSRNHSPVKSKESSIVSIHSAGKRVQIDESGRNSALTGTPLKMKSQASTTMYDNSPGIDLALERVKRKATRKISLLTSLKKEIREADDDNLDGF